MGKTEKELFGKSSSLTVKFEWGSVSFSHEEALNCKKNQYQFDAGN